MQDDDHGGGSVDTVLETGGGHLPGEHLGNGLIARIGVGFGLFALLVLAASVLLDPSYLVMDVLGQWYGVYIRLTFFIALLAVGAPVFALLYLRTLRHERTRRRQMQEELARREELFRSLAETVEEVFFVATPDRDRILYVSPEFEEVFGRPVDVLYEDPDAFLAMIHPEDRERVRELLPRQRHGDYDVEYRIVQPDGSIRWVHARAFPVFGGDGEVERIAGIAADVTELREARRRAEERERMFRTVVESIQEVFFLQDAETLEIRYVSPEVANLFGVDAETVTADPMAWLERVHPEDRQRMEEMVQGDLSSPRSQEFRLATEPPRHVRVHVRPTTGPGGEPSLVGVAEDVTDAKRAEEAIRREAGERARVEELEGLTRVASHNLQEPTRHISRFSQLLERKVDPRKDPEVWDYTELVRDGVLRLQGVVDGLRTYAEVTARSLRVETVDMDACVDKALEEQSSLLEERDAVVHRTDLPTVVGDGGLLCLVVQHLVANAVRHNPRERPGVWIEGWDAAGAVELVVGDDGPGIPERYRERVMELFEQLDREERGGVGVGLAIARRIVERHRGRLEIQDAAEGGVEVRIVLPREGPPGEAIAAPAWEREWTSSAVSG